MKKTEQYGNEIGKAIRERMQGLNTMASPKKKKVCTFLCLMPFLAVIIGAIGAATKNDSVIGIAIIPCLLSGSCQFYVGNFKKGVIYTVTVGGFLVGTIVDLFKLKITGNFRDSNGFPVIY